MSDAMKPHADGDAYARTHAAALGAVAQTSGALNNAIARNIAMENCNGRLAA